MTLSPMAVQSLATTIPKELLQLHLDDVCIVSKSKKILTLRAPGEAISVLGGPIAKYFGCQEDMVFRVDC